MGEGREPFAGESSVQAGQRFRRGTLSIQARRLPLAGIRKGVGKDEALRGGPLPHAVGPRRLPNLKPLEAVRDL